MKNIYLFLISLMLSGCASLYEINPDNIVTIPKERLGYTPKTYTEAEGKIIFAETKNIEHLDCSNKDMEHCVWLALVEFISIVKACPFAYYNNVIPVSKSDLKAHQDKIENSIQKWEVYKLSNPKIHQAFDMNHPFVKVSVEKTTFILSNQRIRDINNICYAAYPIFDSLNLDFTIVNRKAKTPIPRDWINYFQ